MGSFFRTRSARILTFVLLGQASLFYGFSRRESVPRHAPLADFQLPAANNWTMVENLPLDADTLEVLKADDLISRVYQNKKDGSVATLFVAFFETQRTGKAPHSPKNCLPGSGWVPSRSNVETISNCRLKADRSQRLRDLARAESKHRSVLVSVPRSCDCQRVLCEDLYRHRCHPLQPQRYGACSSSGQCSGRQHSSRRTNSGLLRSKFLHTSSGIPSGLRPSIFPI